MSPTTGTTQTVTDMGLFWALPTSRGGRTLTWHTGETGGYSSYFGVDRTPRRAVIVLADVSTAATSTLSTHLLRPNG